MATIGYDLTFVSSMEGKTGEEVFALGLLQGLYGIGMAPYIVVFSTDAMKKQLQKAYPGLHVVEVKRTGKSFYKTKLRKYIRKNPVDIMYYPHIHRYMTVNLPCPTAATAHGMESKEVSARDRRKTLSRLRKIDRIAAAGSMVRDEIISKHRHLTEERLQVICNPLVDIRAGVEIVLKKKFILSVNSDSAQKNLIAILKSFRKIKNEIPHDLVVIGDIDEKGRAYRYIRRAGLNDRVIVTGRISRDILFGYYRNSDLFVNASRYRGFGYTPLEAMACGGRVLSVRMPAITDPEGIDCDEYINNPHNYSEIANKMLIVLYKEIDRDYLKKRAERLMEIYGLEKASRRYAEFLGMGEKNDR
ncbi:MAG TPA: glycosyltransferase [Clostridia bacterium]|nr:glycosyltransferase [Clostridia bacterium]HPQ47470.1 glycosyltransferase [Clostridia bacterium]